MELTETELMELQRQASARNGRADAARHARLILLLSEGLTWAEIRAKLDCSDSYIDRWSKRFAADRLAGLFARHAGRERYKVTERIEARVLAWTTKRKPADGSTHWSSRKLAAELGGDDLAHDGGAHLGQALAQAASARRLSGLQRSRLRGQGRRRDRAVPEPAAARGGVQRRREDRDPGAGPQGPGAAAVARARRTPWLRVLPARHAVAVRGLQHQDRRSAGQDRRRHTSAEFVAFLTDIVANQPKGKEIHVIADNLSAHKTKQVDAVPGRASANVHLHFTPTYSSWLNQVELWFAKIERDVIARGVFTSVPDLKRKLMRYIRHYNKQPKPVKWKYFDPIASHHFRLQRYGPLASNGLHQLGQPACGPPAHARLPGPVPPGWSPPAGAWAGA